MSNSHEIGSLILRLTLGLTFFIHGWSKFQGGIENTANFFSSLGIPGFMAYIVGSIELIGGLVMIVGLGTRIFSALFAAILLVAIFTAKLTAGFLQGYELDVILLAVSIHLILTGSRLYAVDALITRKK
ncbi:DoxX family protein [Salinithrix halophila]|uniref:DoxX family protein n=1 Tax=Salinithrix halophila TaxID=1485204 RepID=A0ABV8JGY5_9BACL